MKKVLFLLAVVLTVFSASLIAESSSSQEFNVPYIDFGVGGDFLGGLSQQYGSGGTIVERDFTGGNFAAFLGGHFPVSRNIAMLFRLTFQNNGTQYPENLYFYKTQIEAKSFGGSLGLRIYLK